MSRDEFMRELEYLLSDIPDEEKADAIGYYRDYLEEAGPENEENVIREFESPERIAAIIRSDISGNLKDGGEFTETGYRDERFRDPNYQMAKRYDLPEVSEERRYQEGERENKHARRRRTMDGNRTVKFILWMILIIAASPMLLGIGGGLAGIAGGLIGILAAAVIGISDCFYGDSPFKRCPFTWTWGSVSWTWLNCPGSQRCFLRKISSVSFQELCKCP